MAFSLKGSSGLSLSLFAIARVSLSLESLNESKDLSNLYSNMDFSEKKRKIPKDPSQRREQLCTLLGMCVERSFQTGGFLALLGKGPDCVADPFGTVPHRCSQ